MNLLNRLALVLICLALIAGAGVVIGLAWAAPQESIDWLGDAAVWLDDHNTDGTKILITVVAAAVAVIAFTLLLMELIPRASGEVTVTGLQVGDAVLTTAAIGQRVEEAVNQVPNVSDVRATVRAKRKGVLVGLDLHVDPDANLAEVTDAACEAARDVLTNKVHVDLLAPPRARIHYRELRLRRGRPATPAPPPAAEEIPPEEPAVDQAPPAEATADELPPPESPDEEPQVVAVGDEEKPVQA